MAYINANILNDLQPGQGYNEANYPERGIIDAVKASTSAIDYLDPTAIEAMRTVSSARNIDNVYIQDQTVTVSSNPGFANIPSSLATTAVQNYTTYDFFSGFRFFPATFQNNQIKADYFRNQTILNVLNEMASSIEVTLETVLSAQKTQLLNYVTQISQGAGTFTFNATTDELEISKASQTDTMIYLLQSIMRANNLPGNYRLITSPAGTASARAAILKYGGANDKNLQFEGNIIQPDRLHESENISTSDVFDGYWMRDGSIGMIENHPYDFVNETSINGGSQSWKVSDMDLPFIKSRCNVYVNNYATNANSIMDTSDSNAIMTTCEEMAFWCRLTVPYRPNSALATRVSDIVKLEAQTS